MNLGILEYEECLHLEKIFSTFPEIEILIPDGLACLLIGLDHQTNISYLLLNNCSIPNNSNSIMKVVGSH